MFTINHNRKHCQIRTKQEVCATGTWRFWVISEGSMEKESLELDQSNVEKGHSSPGYSRMNKSSRVENIKFLRAKIQVCVGMKQQTWAY